MCTLCMDSVFKDYSKHGVGLLFSKQELESINERRDGKFYKTKINWQKKEIEPLMVSPGLRVIDHSMAGEGYWNYLKMAIQIKDIITSIEFLRP